jgi:hypothetical protein
VSTVRRKIKEKEKEEEKEKVKNSIFLFALLVVSRIWIFVYPIPRADLISYDLISRKLLAIDTMFTHPKLKNSSDIFLCTISKVQNRSQITFPISNLFLSASATPLNQLCTLLTVPPSPNSPSAPPSSTSRSKGLLLLGPATPPPAVGWSLLSACALAFSDASAPTVVEGGRGG